MCLIHPPSLKIGRQGIASRHPSASILMKASPGAEEIKCRRNGQQKLASGPTLTTHGSENP